MGQSCPALQGHRRRARRGRARDLEGHRRGQRAAVAAQWPDPDRGHMVALRQDARSRPRRGGSRSRGAGMTTSIVVGAGPNGVAAAVALAKAGVQVTVLEAADEIGGGTRTSEAIIPGLLHDHCAATHPMAVGSQFLAGLGLDRYGLTWRLPEIDCVHPLDGGSAGVLYRSVEATAAWMQHADGARWRRLFGKTSANF